MAKIFTLLCVAFISFSALALRVDGQDKIVEIEELSPVNQAQISGETEAAEAGNGKERDKRFFVKKIGLKAGLVDLVFGKIDSIIDSKTRYINELDKQNIIKNQKYFGITFPPPTTANPLVNNLLSLKKNFLGQAVSTVIQSKIGQLSGSLGFGGGDSDSGSGGALSSLFQTSAAILPGLSAGSGSFGASASLPGLGSASFGADAGAGTGGGASFSASAGVGNSIGASVGASAGYN